MSDTSPRSDVRSLASSVGLYAAAALAQQGVGFILIPIYTRLIDPSEFGLLEIFGAFSAVFFAVLTLGLAPAINKSYHRDCATAAEQAAVLPTALLLVLPSLLLGSAMILVFAHPLSAWLVGSDAAASLLPLVVGSGVLAGLSGLTTTTLRAQQRAGAFGVLTITQFVASLGLNLLFVVGYGLGVRGVLWGTFLSNAITLPLFLWAARSDRVFTISPKLVRPLLHFGLLLVPVTIAGWVMDMSDRYILRLYGDLSAVAVYGVGYKFGMILQVAVVWPFQLAWPAFAFAISTRSTHRETYARTLTYLVAVLAFAVLALSLFTRIGLPVLVGEGYRDAYRVVPLIALAYAFNGVQYCVSPGIHLSGKTRYLTLLSIGAAAINLGLNFLLVPRFGMMGAAWSTTLAFAALAVTTGALARRAYPVAYEYARLLKISVAAIAVYALGTQITAGATAASVVWHAALPLALFPLLLAVSGFFDDQERLTMRGVLRRRVPLFS